MDLQLFDTYTRTVRKFEPLHPPEVGLYTCGPTVYDYAHIGNLRTYIFEDFLRRVLDWNHFPVKHVMNITDVGHLGFRCRRRRRQNGEGFCANRQNCLGDR